MGVLELGKEEMSSSSLPVKLAGDEAREVKREGMDKHIAV